MKTERSLRLAEGLVFAGLAAWLAAAAALVQVEYYDGLDAVANARLFLGQSDHYVVSRGPLLSLLLVPAQWLAQRLALPPLDFAVHHAAMALLHLGYALAAYAAIAGVFGRTRAGLLAFVAAVPCFLFFSYAPFLSHDLIPGAALLGMLFAAERYRRDPSFVSWAALVVLGAAAVLVKHTYALFWVMILVSHAVVCFGPGARRGERGDGASPAAFFRLFAGAVASAAIFWLGLAFVLGFTWPDEAAWLRPLRQIQHMAGQYDAGQYETFPWWLYLRNLPAYGVATMVAIVPGLYLSWRGSRLQRSFVVAWLVAIAAMHVLAAREVRYLAFLAPLSALLIVPAFQWAGRRRPALAVLVLLLGFDLWRVVPEAARIRDPFYTSGVTQRLLEPLVEGGPGPILINWKLRSFRPQGRVPMPGDRYHRVFHVGPHHLGIFYGYGPDDFRQISAPDRVALSVWPEGTLLVFSSGLIVNSRESGAPAAALSQSVSRIESIALRPTAFGYETGDGQRITLEPEASGDYALRGEGLGDRLRRYGLVRLTSGADAPEYGLLRVGPARVMVLGLREAPPADAPLAIRGFAIQSVQAPPSARSGS